LLNSLLSVRIQRMVQAVVYLPHFISWVVVVSIWQEVLGGAGVINGMLEVLGLAPQSVMTDPGAFKGLITAQVIWKEVGWGTIIFFAAISMISSDLYESAAIDGAGPWRRMWHVTLPGIMPVIMLLLILRLGQVLTVGFEQLLLQQAAVGKDAAQVLDTFTYFRGVIGGDWGLATAAGLFKGVVGTIMVIGANKLAKRLGGQGIL
jgi:putative aldouronate transport system permease protein